MIKKIFLQFILLLPFLLLLQISYISANRYNAYCKIDSDCDQNQKCINSLCLCNINERRFWTGDICAICVSGFTITIDRCYKLIPELKTWSEAREYCRARYADLFTWRNNKDEQFIRPTLQSWLATGLFNSRQIIIAEAVRPAINIAWAGATIISLNPHTTKWVDPDGMQLTSMSSEWCDPTIHSGYTLPKEPTSSTRQNLNTTEREQCVRYNFGSLNTNLLCLADDYCSTKYPFICEMNAASMKLANTVLHGSDDEDINFEEQAPTPIASPEYPNILGTFPVPLPDPNTINTPSALSEKSSNSSMAIIVLLGVGVLLIIGAIVGYMMIKKKKQISNDQINQSENISQDRPSFTSSVGSMME